MPTRRRLYRRTLLEQTIVVQSLVTLYYFEFGKEYAFPGELHDFWEMIYVDKGVVEVSADDRRCRLEQGSVIFLQPNEFHSFHAVHDKAPNIIVVTFDCHSEAMKHFERRIVDLNDKERNLLAQIVEEGANAFKFPFRYPLLRHRKQQAPIGSEQMIRITLEMLLIRMLRRIAHPDVDALQPVLSTAAKEKNDSELVERVIRYMESRLHGQVSLEEIAGELHVSKTVLKEQFKKETGKSTKEYFIKMKIDRSKLLIREQPNNFTEISGMLGFSSVHYFSKVFKKVTGMSPSEYAKSVKGRVKQVEA